MNEFEPFPKIMRLSKEIIVTEKLDGTNAQVCVTEDGLVLAGSRNRWLTTVDDNYGFASWVEANREELLQLGPGRHFGEWWGVSIQRGYGIFERRFSLFNVSRWAVERPACCHVVPTLYIGEFDSRKIESCLEGLARDGSRAAPGFMRPEGVVIYHTAARVLFKKTLESDEAKGAAA